MTIQTLTEQFRNMQATVDLGTRHKVAIAAHFEVRSVLNTAPQLTDLGLNDVLIGSYPRKTGIWPGKDVDVFGKLTRATIDTIEPATAYNLFLDVLLDAFGGRVTRQPRSVKVDYRPDALPELKFVREAATFLNEPEPLGAVDRFEFSVDVVPAVVFGDEWGIPNRNPETWTRTATKDRWIRTNPEHLTDLTRKLNATTTISGQGAYVPTVKAIRQIRRGHLGQAKPGGLYFELLVYEGFASGGITGDSWAEITASALTYIANRLRTVATDPLCDPVLNQPYSPQPDPVDVGNAAAVFAGLASAGQEALRADVCPAAAAWRTIFGTNTKANGPVFELPANCRSDGTMMPVFTGTNPIQGSSEARGFGRG